MLKNKPSKAKAFSLMELIVVLIIITTALFIAYRQFSGLNAQNKLKKTMLDIQSAIMQAQNEARKYGKWACLKFNDTDVFVYVDNNQNYGTNINACGDSDYLIAQHHDVFNNNIDLANCNQNIQKSCLIWFNEKGKPMLCSNSGDCSQALSANGSQDRYCIPWHYQMIVSHQSVSDSSITVQASMSRELEIEKDSTVILPKFEEAGENTSLSVNSCLMQIF